MHSRPLERKEENNCIECDEYCTIIDVSHADREFPAIFSNTNNISNGFIIWIINADGNNSVHANALMSLCVSQDYGNCFIISLSN